MSDDEWPSPPYVIHTPRLTLRCYERRDVDAMHEAVLANLEALRPWMPWVEDEPRDRAARTELVRRFRGLFDLGKNFVYGVFDARDGRFLGGSGLHPRQSPGALEIGYWIVQDRWGEGLATEVASALTRVGIEIMEAQRIEIRVEPGNARSLRVPRRLGFREEGILRGVGEPRGLLLERVDLAVFSLLDDELGTSSASKIEIRTEPFA